MVHPLVSVIVPVHNAEPYLTACLESLKRQTYSELEIILVENGSSDASLALCRQLAREDRRIKVLVSPPGVSQARNAGLDAATGTFIQFVDADDRLEPEATRLLVQAALDSGSDLVVAPYYRVIDGVSKFHTLLDEEGPITKPRLVSLLVKDPSSYYWSVLWNKLYRREIIRRCSLRFPEEIGWSEDLLFNLNYFRMASSFFAISQPVYYYVKNEGSITAQFTSPVDILKVRRTIFDCYELLLAETGLYEKYHMQIYKFYFSHAEHR